VAAALALRGMRDPLFGMTGQIRCSFEGS